ncbi:hypothetical protein BDB00DRAFT_817886 [Zychaea mexicana]|uniref:uncharacterized protein n=1 Tax=Zychaea mexicana TaxID=64656 RepID=UPI0022FF05F3|nr:uncharacterized protein BDB00DRAFT_817886 [Zychaea mexicana]KAI9494695.1 hypothetical protein BDB00DRAFT_817886 [Zychaea mexicana]
MQWILNNLKIRVPCVGCWSVRKAYKRERETLVSRLILFLLLAVFTHTITMPRKTSGPKLFKCAGYGDCDMVFTRSEHLARHSRKHTGEKPFKCIVPGCERMFSRFDNMMQHTHTHERSQHQHPQRRRSSVAQSYTLPQPSSQPQQQEKIPPFSKVVAGIPPPPPFSPPVHEAEEQDSSYASSLSPLSPTGLSSEYYNDPTVMTEPNSHQADWRPTKRRLSAIDLQTPIEHWTTKTIEVMQQDQQNAVLEVDNDYNLIGVDNDNAVVDVTPEEYEAIQGFGRFHSQSMVRRSDSPGARMQVNFFRQHSLPVQESFQRPARSHAI